MDKNKFNFIVPAELEKSKDGEWKIRGLASTENVDQQGETIMQKGIDLTPIDKKKGIINFDHQKGPENTIGLLDGYKRGSQGLYIEGRLFKNHSKAKAVREIMSSLSEGDRGRVGLSVEGQILERDSANPKIIKKCRINAVAVTLNPVNTDSYADLVKSMNSSEELEFDSHEQPAIDENNGEPTFTADQVMSMIQKALGIGAGNAQPAGDMSGGDALGQEDLEKDKKKKKKLKKMDKCIYKSNLIELMDKLQYLYPGVNKVDLWVAVQERMKTQFPDINENFGKAGFRLKQMSGKEREHKLYEDARQRSDYEENKNKTRAQLATTAKESGAEKKEQAKIRAQRDASIQAGEDRDHVRPGVQ